MPSKKEQWSAICGPLGMDAKQQRRWLPSISAIVDEPCTATGTAALYLPPGPECDHILVLIRLGVRFKAQQVGKRPGVLARLVLDCTRRAGPPYSFAQLLDELEREAARRELHGEAASPIEKVDRIWQLVTIHLPRRGRVQVSFGTLRNHLTAAKIKLRADIQLTAKP